MFNLIVSYIFYLGLFGLEVFCHPENPTTVDAVTLNNQERNFGLNNWIASNSLRTKCPYYISGFD
ncbi:unnamed protein product, partial [Allacma fusca]